MVKKLHLRIFNYLSQFNPNIKTKLDNVCGKTGRYNVPEELFQKRTTRSNRVLISWKTVQENNLTLKELESFSGGVVVEFLNNDFFDEKNLKNSLFVELKNRLGSDNNVSSMISIRAENGSSSSAIPRQAFSKLINNFEIKYNDKTIIINSSNYNNYAIRRNSLSKKTKRRGIGNNLWEGFLYVSIKGGQQDVIETHNSKDKTNLFNPACEFATQAVMEDLNLTLGYFALNSLDKEKLTKDQLEELFVLKKETEYILKTKKYDNPSYKGNLLDFCLNHPSLKIIEGQLTDPILLQRIDINNFNEKERDLYKAIDLTHDESVAKNKFYWDTEKECLLSAARPTNLFWSFHLSNMMQQDYNLDEYFKHEEDLYLKRRQLSKG